MPAAPRYRLPGGRRTRTGAGTAADCSDLPIDEIAGRKKLVPTTASSVIMIAETNKAGNASRPRIDAMKMPHTVSGIRISVIPRQRACSTVVT
jgi:hypothetical protein